MDENKKIFLKENELVVMMCIWEMKNKEVICQEIKNIAKEKFGYDYQTPTLYSFLNALKKKGFINSYRRGVIFFYPLIDKDSYFKEQMNKICNMWFNNNIQAMVLYFVKNLEITKDEKKQILDKINKI